MQRQADKALSRQEVISELRRMEPQLRAKGLSSLHLYGSVARDEARSDSDVDMFVDLDPAAELGGFAFFGIAGDIEDRLGKPVQLATREGLHELLRDRIVASAVKVF